MVAGGPPIAGIPARPGLRSASLTGDPVLERCLRGEARLMAEADGVSAMRLQAALIELGFPVGHWARMAASGRIPRGR